MSVSSYYFTRTWIWRLCFNCFITFKYCTELKLYSHWAPVTNSCTDIYGTLNTALPTGDVGVHLLQLIVKVTLQPLRRFISHRWGGRSTVAGYLFWPYEPVLCSRVWFVPELVVGESSLARGLICSGRRVRVTLQLVQESSVRSVTWWRVSQICQQELSLTFSDINIYNFFTFKM